MKLFFSCIFFFTLILLNAQNYKADRLYNKAVKAYDKKLYTKAIAYLDKAILLNATDSDYFSERGCAKDEIGLYNEALKDFDIAIKLKPKESDFYYNRANALFDAERFSEALMDYETALELNPMCKDCADMVKETFEIIIELVNDME